MQKKMLSDLTKELERNLTTKSFLKNMKYTKKNIQELFKQGNWKHQIERTVEADNYSWSHLRDLMQPTLEKIAPEPPEGWFSYMEACALNTLYPQNYDAKKDPKSEKGRFFILEILRTFYRFQKRFQEFNPKNYMRFIKREEAEEFHTGEEYLRFIGFCKDNYIYEFLRLVKENTPYNILGHISGVHFIAMHVATQLYQAGVPIDLTLVSGAAAGHDIGKLGCRPDEAKRIPYLHYYYTDDFFKRNQMYAIGHTATNHSTWDLELENLSVESLILIYSDFRVKGARDEQGKEQIYFYTLKDSFDVILNKLDNVDEAKRNRYIRVYNKLRDFEEYMISLGVNTEPGEKKPSLAQQVDASLLSSQGVTEHLKYHAISHNIFLMNKLNGEISLANIIEAARSEKKWKNIRAYVNIFEEYFTYMSSKQKEITLNFLYELLMHREGDIRRQAADLIGNIIVNYDEEYRKEMPEHSVRIHGEITALDLWKRTLQNIIHPDHKVTEQHRRWIGYSLKLLVESVLKRCKQEEGITYLTLLLTYFQEENYDDATAFIMVDALRSIPLTYLDGENIVVFNNFTKKLTDRKVLEINVAILRFLKHYTDYEPTSKQDISSLSEIMTAIEEPAVRCVGYLKEKICENLQEQNNTLQPDDKKKIEVFHDPHGTSAIFLENLKTATPWSIKAVNIELLLDQINSGNHIQVLHVATHFSNLIKVSERVAVRHRAGRALLAIMPILTLDQRNEVVIELTKGLEIGEYEISKYIPQYLGQLALYLHPNELDEFIGNLTKLFESTNEKVGSVAFNTIGILVEKYPGYREQFQESHESYYRRKERILGMLLRGLANYNEVVSQEALLVIGQYIFGSKELSLEEKSSIYHYMHKKLLNLFVDQEETELSFFNNAASLNHIYRFISDYTFEKGRFDFKPNTKVAFFPGTFDPFSLSHKGIVKEIRNLGFEVYLALDEFSWSKKTQPRMIRRKIINMSVADENNVYLFPDHIPINIANPKDIRTLTSLFPRKDVYIVVGSDVILNASSYKGETVENSVLTLNHVVFRRDSISEGTEYDNDLDLAYKKIKGKIVELKLPMYLEDISSTRIRENIDLNRDISNLIDTVAQNFIYDNSLYLREPQYKSILQAKAISFEVVTDIQPMFMDELEASLLAGSGQRQKLRKVIQQSGGEAVIIRDGERNNQPVALAFYHHVSVSDLYHEFKNPEVSAYLRESASGKIIVINGIFSSKDSSIRDLKQLVLTETLAYSLKHDFTFAVYNSSLEEEDADTLDVLVRQGFAPLEEKDGVGNIYTVDMKSPITLFENIETTLKDPLNRNENVIKVLDQAHKRLQRALTKLYPGNLVLSFNSGVMHHQLIDRITKTNQVPAEPLKVRKLGASMCVPFGKILRGMAVPNTVTKALHTEKVFDPEMKGFEITHFPHYSPLINQVRTLKSFKRPVLLVDDLLHKGYRIKKLDPLFKSENVQIDRIIVGILSGRGKDLMTIQKRSVESVYFIPNLKIWFVESTIYPFIGGDSIRRKENLNAGLLPSINMVLPYVAPRFLTGTSKEALYEYSLTCLENARDIMVTLEQEYQKAFEKKLTLNRLSEAVIFPRIPDKGLNMFYDLNLAPSSYILNDIENLIRLKEVIIT